MWYTVFSDNLFHFKLDQERYSIKPEDFVRLPLYDEGHVQSSTYLNEFFFLVLSRFFQWQGMTAYVPVDDEAAANMAKTMLTPLNQTSSGPAMPEIPVISKKMVAYLESFLAVAPYRKTTDMKIDTKIDKLYESAMKKLGAVNDANYCNYMERKLRAWYRRFPPKQVTDDAKAEMAAENAAVAEADADATTVGDSLVMSDDE